MGERISAEPAVRERAARARDVGERPGYAFKNLAWAQFGAQPALREGQQNDRTDQLDALRRQFETEEGQIEREYWAEHTAMAVVLTAKPRRSLLRRLGLSPRYALHRSTESAELPYELEAALSDGDTLAAKAAVVLNGGAALTVLNRIFVAHKFLLSAADAEMGADPNWALKIRDAREENEPTVVGTHPDPGRTAALAQLLEVISNMMSEEPGPQTAESTSFEDFAEPEHPAT